MCVSSVKQSKVQHCCLTKTNSCAALTSDESLLGEEGEVLLRRWNQKPIKQGRPVAHSLPLVLPAFGQAAPFHCLITKAKASSVTIELFDFIEKPLE